jgi:hypothetical protein
MELIAKEMGNSGDSGAMQEEKTRKNHVYEEVGVEKYLTENDNRCLLVTKNKSKSNKLTFNEGKNFDNSEVIPLDDYPVDLIHGLNEAYEENFLNVTLQQKVDALKKRYVQYEEIMKSHLLKKFNVEYRRVHINELDTENQVVIIGYLKSSEEDNKISANDF